MAKTKPAIRQFKNAKGPGITQGSPTRRRRSRRSLTPTPELDKAQLAADLYRLATANQQAGALTPSTPDSAEAEPGMRTGMIGEGSVADSLFSDAPPPPMPGNDGDPRVYRGTPAGDALAAGAADLRPEPGWADGAFAAPPPAARRRTRGLKGRTSFPRAVRA